MITFYGRHNGCLLCQLWNSHRSTDIYFFSYEKSDTSLSMGRSLPVSWKLCPGSFSSPLPRENRFCIIFPFSLPKTALFKTETKYKLYRRRHGNVFSELDLKSDNLSCHGLDKFTIISTTISRSYISTNSLASQYWGSLASLQCSQNHERSVVKPR